MPLGRPYGDERGAIVDLLEQIDCVTEIFTYEDAVRGNHVHHETVQWTYVVRGCLRIVTPGGERMVSAGELWRDEPGTPHAWQALEDTVCLVFTRGPRSGADYESDTERLVVPLI